MYFFHNIIKFALLFVFLFVSLGVSETFAQVHLTYISPESNKVTIKKLQNVFSGLGLYSGKIDGKYDSLKKSLVAYQLQHKIISHETSDDAGYYGVKTASSLEKNYGKKFLDLKKKYLIAEKLHKHKEGNFTVTAYYTPLKGQKKYQRGSYSADIALNGRGITASGKKPFAGALALPRNYKFGTKIYLDGLGVGVVEDRGGAIVNSGENGQLHDRIDIWVGYGDEGRERAIHWGKRKVKGFIVDDNDEISIEFGGTRKNLFVEKHYDTEENIVNLKESEKKEDSWKNTSKKISLKALEAYKNLRVDGEDPNSDNVKKLQTLFQKIGLYSKKITGRYEDIKETLVEYQKSKGITAYLGYFGKITYSHLEKDFVEGNEIKKEKKVAEKVSYALSKNEKKNILIVSNKLKTILKTDFKIRAFRNKLKKMIVKLETEKQKAIIFHLIEIL